MRFSLHRRITNDLTKDERGLGELEYALAEAWMRKHFMTRFVRFVLTILIAFIATTAFVQGNNRDQCERSKPFLKSYSQFVLSAARAREADAKSSPNPRERRSNTDTAEAYRRQYELIKPGVTADCNDQYPIIPLLGF